MDEWQIVAQNVAPEDQAGFLTDQKHWVYRIVPTPNTYNSASFDIYRKPKPPKVAG
jgi:hypothetical protein